MTDARMPSRWLTDLRFEQLSDRAYRVFMNGLAWSNEQGTDGAIPVRAMKFLHPDNVDTKTRAELIACGLWEADGLGIIVPQWSQAMGQETAENIQRRRDSNRERQRNTRARRTTKTPESRGTPTDVTRDITRDEHRDVTRESLGQDTTGQARTGQDAPPEEHNAKVTNWPTREPGADGWEGADVSSF